MERTQFTFYESFFKAISRIKKKADRADAYDAICAYALYETEPDIDSMSDAAAIAFISSKPNLDASRRKANSGKRGGKGKQTGSKTEANGKQELDIELDKELDIEKEQELMLPPYPPDRGDPAVSAVMTAYLNFNPAASPESIDELLAYANTLGQEVCIRAINIARDERKTTWSYIRGILRRLQSQGVKSLSDWEAAEAKRKEETNAGTAEHTSAKRWNIQVPNLDD